MEELLRLEGVSYSYEERFTALKNVSATFQKGERIAVLGNNGAGKSTFFLCCNGVVRPQGGRLLLKGQEVKESKKHVMRLRQTVGLVFQDPDSQIIAGTVESEVSFGPMNLLLDAHEVEARVAQSLERMNLSEYRDRAPHYLSGGEKKRVSIADILAMRPEMILLDEPTASLDPQNVVVLEKTLDELSGLGIALAVSTHDVDFAYRFARRAIVFSRGEIIADGGIDEVFASDEVLSEAGLRKPLLYAAAQALESRLNISVTAQKPRYIEEFEDYVQRIMGKF